MLSQQQVLWQQVAGRVKVRYSCGMFALESLPLIWMGRSGEYTVVDTDTAQWRKCFRQFSSIRWFIYDLNISEGQWYPIIERICSTLCSMAYLGSELQSLWPRRIIDCFTDKGVHIYSRWMLSSFVITIYLFAGVIQQGPTLPWCRFGMLKLLKIWWPSLPVIQ